MQFGCQNLLNGCDNLNPQNIKNVLIAIKSANLWAMALFIVFLFFVAPILFTLLDTKSSTYLFINRSIGLSVAYTFIAMMVISLLAPKHYWLHELTYGKVWLSGLIGSLLFTILYINYANALMIKVSLAIWVCLVALTALISFIHQHKKHKHLAHEYNQFDQSTIFDPDKSNASNIIEVQSTEHGEKLGEFLLDQNITIEILNSALHGGHLLKLTQYEHVAYARTTNLTLDNFQRFMVDGNAQHLTDKPLWNIEIAFIGNTRGMYTNVLNAVMEMNNAYRAKLINAIKVRPYQSLNTLFEHNHSLRLLGNKKLIHLAYHNNQLEIETEHEFEDSKVKYIRTTTVWLNDGGLICSESKGINEDITVSTEDVPLTYVDLPFEENSLTCIEIQKDIASNTPTKTLILTIEALQTEIDEKHSEIKIEINLNVTPITVQKISANKLTTMSIAQYRKQHCFYCYEIQGVIHHIHTRLEHKYGRQAQYHGDAYKEVTITVLSDFLVDNPEYQKYEEWLLRELQKNIRQPEKSEAQND